MRYKLSLALLSAGLAIGLSWRGVGAQPPIARPVERPPPVAAPAPEAHAATPIENTEWDHCRAGWPQETSCLAVHADTGHYVGYYVGGGCACYRRGDAPHPDEGTWGWDYRGWLVPRHVILRWWHGRYQGGTGAYATDGPNLKHHLEEHRTEHHTEHHEEGH
jgi:hypothetical protein